MNDDIRYKSLYQLSTLLKFSYTVFMVYKYHKKSFVQITEEGIRPKYLKNVFSL